MADLSFLDPYQLTRHPQYAGAKEAAEAAREAHAAAADKADALIQEAKALKAEADEAARAGDDEAADRLLEEHQQAKAKAERQHAIASAREDLAVEKEHALQVAQEKATRDVQAWARHDRADALDAVLGRLADLVRALEDAKDIDRAVAAKKGTAVLSDDTMRTLQKMQQDLEAQADADRSYASHRSIPEPIAA